MSKLICQECRGHGRVTEEIIFGTPRRELCGWCNGTGEVTPEVRGIWLREQKEFRRGRRLPREQEEV